MKFGKLIGALDEGRTSVRFGIFEAGTDKIVCFHQIPVPSITPNDGWCEQDPMEIYRLAVECIQVAIRRIERLGASARDIVGIGITNQRETTVVWDRVTGKPLCNAIMSWDNRATKTVNELLDSIPSEVRIKDSNYLRQQCGLPLSPYFPAVKLRWLKNNVPNVKTAMENGCALFGTIDTWLIYNLTGAEEGGIHITDVTNASRTMLMNLEKLQWSQELLDFFDLPRSILPEIHTNVEKYGEITLDILQGVPITACLGNQNASLIGQQCLRRGDSKATFGAGCSLLYNTGNSIVHSNHGLLTTVAYQLGPGVQPTFALEGSVAGAGDAFSWLRDNMGLINTVNEVESMARMVPNSLDVFFVPAFSGLSTPYWNQAARGVICGLSEETTSEHIIRATLEAICFQLLDILEAMKKDCKGSFDKLLVDGAMTSNILFMQLLADLLGVRVICAKNPETTALGAALAAFKAIEPNFNLEALLKSAETRNTYKSTLKQSKRDFLYHKWKMAIENSLNWDTSVLPDDGRGLYE